MAYGDDETCGWPFDEACYAPPEGTDENLLRIAKNLTVSTLRTLTLYRVGGCPVTVRPCVARCFAGFNPHLDVRGQWVNACGCPDFSLCGCGVLSSVRLAPPVGQITEVKVDGVVLDPSAYHLLDGTHLVRTDGQSWPVTQDLTKPDTDVGTFSVSYVNGYAPDDAAAWAASLLLEEFLKACRGENCKLSSRVQSIARRGVTSEIRETVLMEGRTGIAPVDAWIMQWNPHGLRTRPNVYSPELRRNRVVT